MLSSVVNTSVSWCQANLPVEAARERIPLVDTSLRLADAYGMPVVVKVDSIIDAVIDKGNSYAVKSAVAMEAVEGMRDSLWEKEGDVRDKVDDFVTEKKNELINAKQVAITKVNGAYQVVSSTLSEIPTCVDLDSRLVGAVLGLRDRLLTITAKGLDMTLGHERRAIIFERGSAAYEGAAAMVWSFLGVQGSAVPMPASPTGSSTQAATDKASETSTVEPMKALNEKVDEKSCDKVELCKPKSSSLSQ